jgi:murein hydrolase activator
MRRSLGIAALICLAGASAAIAENKKEDLEKYEEKIREQKQRLKNALSKEGSLHQELKKISGKVDRLNQQIDELDSQRSGLHSKISDSEKTIEKLKDEISAKKGSVANVLRTLYMQGEPTYLKALVASRTADEFRWRGYLARKWMEKDQSVIRSYREMIDQLKSRKTRLEADEDESRKTMRELTKSRAQLSQERADRSELLAMVKNQRDYYEKSIRELEQAAKDLQHLMETLQNEKKGEESIFLKMRGQLPLPVPGAIEKKFGPYFDSKFSAKLFHKGIDIRAPEGKPIVAVFDGRVIFSDWFVGYGKILIVDHGSGYFTLYAHLKDTAKKVGESVQAGETIARVGDSGSLKGSYLYFELRHKGISQDPWPWFAASSRQK